MQKLNEYADRVVLLLLVVAVAVLGLYVSKLNSKVTELSQRQAVVREVVVVTPTLTATPSAKLLPTKTLLRTVTAAPVVTKAVVK